MKNIFKDNDTLYFLHIPKTAGVSLIDFLDDYFDIDTILPHQTWRKLLPQLPPNLNKYKFIRGHFGYNLHSLLNKKPIYITMLREPIARAISNFEHYKRDPGKVIIDKFKNINPDSDFASLKLSDKFSKFLLCNNQCRYLSIDTDVIKWKNEMQRTNFVNEVSSDFVNHNMNDKEILFKAKQRLLEFPFFGITEYMEKSIQLLCFTFGWKHNRRINHLNVTPNKIKKIDADTIEEIKKYNALDFELYDFAKKEFFIRYNKMEKILKNKYFESSLSNLSENELISKLLDKYFEEEISQKSVVSEINYDMSMPLCGSGWNKREYDKNNNYFRWSGPGIDSTLYFPKMNKEKNFVIIIKIRKTILNGIEKSVKIFVNNTLLDYKEIEYDENFRILRGEFSGKVFESINFLEIKFVVSKTIQPNKINSNIKDDRMLGISLSNIEIREK